MDKNIIIAIVLGVLIVIAGVQAFQLMGMKSSGSNINTASANVPAQSGGSAPSLPSNLDNLPGMVGGC